MAPPASSLTSHWHASHHDNNGLNLCNQPQWNGSLYIRVALVMVCLHSTGNPKAIRYDVQCVDEVCWTHSHKYLCLNVLVVMERIVKHLIQTANDKPTNHTQWMETAATPTPTYYLYPFVYMKCPVRPTNRDSIGWSKPGAGVEGSSRKNSW